MNGGGPGRATVVSVALTLGALVFAGALALAGALPSRVACALAAAFFPYAVLLRSARPLRLRWTLVLAGVGGLVLALAPSVLSDDLYRYLWDGRVLRAGLDPYAHAPSDPALAPLRDELWRRVNHPRVPTIYPPLAQGLFAGLGLVHHPLAMKLGALAAHLAAVPLVGRLSAAFGGEPRRAAMLLALNPLALSESALGGHVDAFVGLFLGLAVFAVLKNRVGGAVAALVAAAATKLVGLLVVPLLWRRHPVAAAVALVLGIACLVPLVGAGDERTVGGFGQYARRWSGNAGAYRVLEAGTAAAFETTHGVGRGRVRFATLRPAFRELRDTRWDPMASFQREKKERGVPAELEASVVGALGARAFGVLALLLGALALARRSPDPGETEARRFARSARVLLLLGLLLAPQVHPWYLLWLLPLELALGGGPVLVFSAAVWVAYAPLDGWVLGRLWREPVGAAVFEHGLVWLAFLVHMLPVAARTDDEREAKLSVGSRVSGRV